MTRAEPFIIVRATIEALLKIKADADEILIVDNNHENKALYEPLEAYVASLNKGLNVRFFHEDHIAGYKAGALNYALNLMSNRCDYIVVVDSDYQALPWARHSIVSAVERYSNKVLLQFPQYYRDANKPDIHSELNHYFSYHLNKPSNAARALSTGTFAVIRKTALIQMGGWSGDSITEDAQMGVLMHLKGAQTQYVRQIIATGLLPCNLADLIAQRRRWIYGNMQVLMGYPKLIWQHRTTADNTHTQNTPLQENNHSILSKPPNDQVEIADYSDKPFLVTARITNADFDSVETLQPSTLAELLAIPSAQKRQKRQIKKDAALKLAKPIGLNQPLTPNYHHTHQTLIKSEKQCSKNSLEKVHLNGFSLANDDRQTINFTHLKYLRAHISQLSAWVNFTAPFILAQTVAIILFIDFWVSSAVGVDFTSLSLGASSEGLLKSATSLLRVCYGAYFIFMGRRLWAYVADARPLCPPPAHITESSKHHSKPFTVKTAAASAVTDIKRHTRLKKHPQHQDAKLTKTSANQHVQASTPISARLRAWLIHLSFWELGALSWLPVLWGQQKPFVCTPKIDTSNQSIKPWKATLTVLPKLLIGLNVATAVLVAPLSTGLLSCALTVVGIKSLGAWVMIENFDGK